MNKIKALAIAALVGMATTGCEDKLYENVNPDVAHSTTCQLGLPVVVFYAGQVNYDNAEYNIYLSQCLTTMGKSQTGTYAYKSGWQFLTMNRHPMWRRHFYDIGVNANNLIANSKKINSPNFEYIGRVVKLLSTQLTTDQFGEMPHREAYQSNSPKYDSQETIYQDMFDECDYLINNFSEFVTEDSKPIDWAMDRVYGGNLENWKGLVYAIKARLLLRNIPNIDCSQATCQKVIDAAQKAIDTWRSTDNIYGEWFGSEPRYNFDGGITESNAQWSQAQPIINSWESRANLLDSAVPSKFFVHDCMQLRDTGKEIELGYYEAENGLGLDPRLMLLFVPQNGPVSASNANTRVMLRYLENNIGAGSTFKQAHYPNLFAGAFAGGKDAYTSIFTMEELYFMQAEAYYWMGNKAKACDIAKEASQWNIQRHLDRFQYDNPDCYPSGASLAPSKLESAKTRFESYVNVFLNNNEPYKKQKLCEDYNGGKGHWYFNPSTFNLSDLMIQKYIAMYMQPEQWTDMRRYHFSNNRNGYGIGDSKEIIYPTLRRPYNLYQAFWIDGLTEAEKENSWMQRINPDPETEEKYNLSELERLGASKNHLWLRKPLIWAKAYGEQSSLTAGAESNQPAE